MARLIPHHQFDGQRGQIVESYQAAHDLRQAFSYPDDLQGFDDLLEAIGANRSSYMRPGNQEKLMDAVRRGEWVMVRPKMNEGSGGASWNAFKTKPEPEPAQHLGLQMTVSAMKVDEVCRTGREEECKKVKFTEGGKLTGAITGAAVGGVVGNKLGIKACAKVKGVGKLVCVLVVGAATSTAGGEVTGFLGEQTGEEIYEGTLP